jgi:uncharacterized protein (TIGR00369 family)
VRLEVADLVERGRNRLPGYLGIEVDGIEDGHTSMHVDLREKHLAPNGFLHAGTVVTLADSACGYGCIMSLPDGATGFTTIELKTNFLATALQGTLYCEANRVHGGRTTQVWDATVTNEEGKTLALFRCTQLLLYP